MRNVVEKYFNLEFNVIILAIRTAVLITCISLLQDYLKVNEALIVACIFGIFLVALIEVITIDLYIKYSLLYGILSLCVSSLIFALGVHVSNNCYLTVAILIIASCLVGFSNNINNKANVNSIVILFITNFFIIGNGFTNEHIHISMLFFGGFFFLGGALMVISGYGYYLIRIRQLKNDYKYLIKPDLFKELLNSFQVNKINLLFAISLAMAITIAYLVEHFLKVPQGYWMPMTALLILKANHDLSRQAMQYRLIGTLLGTLVALGICTLISNKFILSLLLFPTIFLMIITLARHYGAYVFFLTNFIIILFKLFDQNGEIIIRHRIIDTVTAVIIVATVVYGVLLLDKIYTRKI
jgi:hypothetical protein